MRFAIDLNEVVGVKDSKLVMGGKGFYKQCVRVTLDRHPSGKSGTLIVNVVNDDRNLVTSSLQLDLAELLYPSPTVITLDECILFCNLKKLFFEIVYILVPDRKVFAGSNF